MVCKSNWEAKLSPMLREPCGLNSNSFGRVIIELAQDDERKIVSFIEKNHGIIKRKISLVPSIVAEVPLSMIPELAQSIQVKKIWVDTEVISKQDQLK